MNVAKVIVIGSNSFSGASFIRYLLSHGVEVVGISRSPEPVRSLLPYKWYDHKLFTFYQMDLNKDIEVITEVIRRFRPPVVVNFASQSMVAESWRNPEDWFETNVVANIRLHDQLRRQDFIQRYVHVSTPEVYGTCTGSISEEALLNPTTPYAVSRAACDMSLKTFHKGYDFPVVITRAANVYGSGQQLYRIIPRTIFSILKKKKLPLHGGGTSMRSFIHISDVAEGTWQVATRGTPGEIYHLSTEQLFSIREIVERICLKMGAIFSSVVDITDERLGKDAAYILDSRKAREGLGWKDTVDIDSGLNETISWVKANLEELESQPVEYIHKK